jgi:hypothetical protein
MGCQPNLQQTHLGPEHVWSVSVMPPVEMDLEIEVGGWRDAAPDDGPLVVDADSVRLERADGLRDPRWVVSAVIGSEAAVQIVARQLHGTT